MLGLAVLDAADLHVEHVDLAVDGLDLAVGADVDGRVGDPLVSLAALRDRAGDEVDAELAGGPPGPLDRASVERLGALAVVARAAAQVEALREDDELRAVGCGGAREAIRSLEVAVHVVRLLELYGRGAHVCLLPTQSHVD